jgi:hypothetical protein
VLLLVLTVPVKLGEGMVQPDGRVFDVVTCFDEFVWTNSEAVSEERVVVPDNVTPDSVLEVVICDDELVWRTCDADKPLSVVVPDKVTPLRVLEAVSCDEEFV